MFGLRNLNQSVTGLLHFLRSLPTREFHYYRSHRLAIVGLGVIWLSAFLVRYIVILRYHAPPGADYGNYLTNLHSFLGNDVTAQPVQYPPVFLTYLWAAVSIFGEIGGLQFSGPFLAASLSVPSYLLLRNYANGRYALGGAALIAFSEGVSEMIGWGGNPNLLGMIFGTFFVAFLARYVARAGKLDLLKSAVSFALLAGSHQVSLPYFGFVAVLAFAILAVVRWDIRAVQRGITGIVLGAVASTPFIPFYLSVIQSSSGLLPSKPILLTLSDGLYILTWLRESLLLWFPVAVVASLGYRRLWTYDKVAFSFGVALLVTPPLLAMTLMSAQPIRPLYFAYLGIVPGALVFVQHSCHDARPRKVLVFPRVNRAAVTLALVLAFGSIAISDGYLRAVQSTDWYLVVNDEVMDGLRWIKQNSPTDSVVATSGPGQYAAEGPVGCAWGWWIEGYAQRKALCTVDPRGLAWAFQVQQAVEAERAFAGPMSMENGLLRIADYSPFGPRGNPIVSGDFGGGYEPFVYFNDARVIVQWHPGNGSPRRTDISHFLPGHSVARHISPDHVRVTFMAADGDTSVVRTLELQRAASQAWVNYSFSVVGAIDQASISVFSTSASRFVKFDSDTRTLSIGGIPRLGERVEAFLRIEAGYQALWAASLAIPDAGVPELVFAFSPKAATYSVSFAVGLSTRQVSESVDVRVFEATQLFAAARVNLVLVDKTNLRHWEWLTGDKMHFRIIYQNLRIALFEVR